MALLQKSFHYVLGGLFDEVTAPYHMLNDSPASIFSLSQPEMAGRLRNNDEAINYAQAYITKTKAKASSGDKSQTHSITRFENTVNEWVDLQKQRKHIAALTKKL